MRGDIARLGRCTAICTQGEDTIRRSKPFKYAYEKEIVMYASPVSSPVFLSMFRFPSTYAPPVMAHRYAYFKKLDYFSTECIYSPDAYRGHARAFLKDLEAARPSAIIDIIHSGEAFEVKDEVRATQKTQRMYYLL
jgi:cytoplasmic tRNA 2-thiolation protein 1